MGLDWNPASKPRPGHETEYWHLFEALGQKDCPDSEAKEERFDEVSISAFETLNAPRVGVDAIATAWAEQQYSAQGVTTPLPEWLKQLEGLYVVPLVPPCDGVPRYSNGSVTGYVEPFSFRAQFLRDCEYIIGNDLLERGYSHMRPEALREYGLALQARATAFASERQIDVSNLSQPDDLESTEFHLDVVLSASRWCLFWASRGHPLEAYW